MMLEATGFWDSPVVVAFLTVTLPLLIGQYANARKVRQEARTTADAQQVVAAENDAKLDTVHELVNSNLSHQKEMVAILQEQLRAAGHEPHV